MNEPPRHYVSFWGRISREVDPPPHPLQYPTAEQVEIAVDRLDAHLLFRWQRYLKPAATADEYLIMRLIVRGMSVCRVTDLRK